MPIVYHVPNARVGELQGQYYNAGTMFNPVQDCQGRWIISAIEVQQCTNATFLWVKDLPAIEWCPPQTDPAFP